MDENLKKSIDMLIEDIFNSGDESVEKSIDIAHDAAATADEVKVPKGINDKDRNAGRSKDPSGTDATYDDDISEEQDEEDVPEADQVSAPKMEDGPAKKKFHPTMVKKSEDVVELSKEDYETLMSIKKSFEAQEELKKSQETAKVQEDLIKSAVHKETEALRKSLEEQTALIKAFAKTPERPKSITGISQLEKSVNSEAAPQETYTKRDLLEVAEELVKSRQISMEDVIELEMTGSINNAASRKAIEDVLYGKK